MRLADCFTAGRLAEHLRPWRPYPPIAGRQYWGRVPRETREHLLISIRDSWELSQSSQRSVCYLITPEELRVAGATIVLPSGLVIDVDATVDGASAGDISVERRDLDDPQLRATWGEHLYRITLALPGQRGSLSTLITRGGAGPQD
jgi:hypothetical protein